MANSLVISMVGALVKIADIQTIEKILNDKKEKLNLKGEIKWTKVTGNYLEKYIDIINLFFSFVKSGKIKVRIMFAQNAYVSDGLTKEHTDNEYNILYYFFLKNSLYRYNHELKQNNIEITEIVEIDSKKHVIQQCMDIILGSMNFKLNGFNELKDPDTKKKSKRTIAKNKLYKVISTNIREIRKGFNIGISTGIDGNPESYWKHLYRHWNFISTYSHFDKSLTKKNNRKNKK